jgi:hypothetical protein
MRLGTAVDFTGINYHTLRYTLQRFLGAYGPIAWHFCPRDYRPSAQRYHLSHAGSHGAARGWDGYRRRWLPSTGMGMWDIVVSCLAPCQWFCTGSIWTISPTVTSCASCSVATMSVLWMMIKI